MIDSLNALNANEEERGGSGGGWGCGPEQLAAAIPCAGVYSGWVAMARIHKIIRRGTQLLAVFC